MERIQEYSSLDSEQYKQDLRLTEGPPSSSASVVVSPLTGSPRGSSSSSRSGKGRVEFRKLFMKYHTSSLPVLR